MLQVRVTIMCCKFELQSCVASSSYNHVLQVRVTIMCCKFELQSCVASSSYNHVLQVRVLQSCVASSSRGKNSQFIELVVLAATRCPASYR